MAAVDKLLREISFLGRPNCEAEHDGDDHR